ncbi:virulence protein [Caproicibacter fermentans]|uniref:Virulence protein n=1 Tax=Caproicibacter fermentans TaxID=2576756 RepID=A0A7G8TCX0_9FIRM|nr:virulence protein [Caproicibacter fermentans]QNK41461.1 virulence protein [Caproicibacter fermentans]
MEFRFNVTGSERKRLTGAISEILNAPMKYLGAPGFGYEVGDYTVDKDGTVSGEYNPCLLSALAGHGFKPEPYQTLHFITPRGTLLIEDRFDTDEEARAAGYGMYFTHEGRDIYSKPSGNGEHSVKFAIVGAPLEETPDTIETPEEPDRLVIEVPADGFTPEKLDNLTKLAASKAALIKTALGTDDLPIEPTGETLRFPWFSGGLDGDTVSAYTQFIAALCKTAKEKKRVTAKVQDEFENPRFTMRVWLIGLGMVGDDYKLARKLLLQNLTGNAAWRHGAPEKKAASDPADDADAGEINPAALTAPAEEETAPAADTGANVAEEADVAHE